MKKTRAEKRLADLRRILELERGKNMVEYRPTIASDDGRQKTENGIQMTEDRRQKVNAAQPQSQSIYIYPVQLIRKDLTKTLVLCILAISLELGLYFLLEKPGLLPF